MPPNFPLANDWVKTAPWKFCMRLPCFQSAPIPTKLSTWKMSFKTGMKSSWFWNSKYFIFVQSCWGSKSWNSPQIFYLQDNLNTIESLLCIKSTLDLKKMQWHWFWKDGWKALMEIWTPSAWLLHFGSKQKTYILLFLALPHETLMSKHFIREFWTLHFICKIGRDEILGIWESRDFTPFLTYPNLP